MGTFSESLGLVTAVSVLFCQFSACYCCGRRSFAYYILLVGVSKSVNHSANSLRQANLQRSRGAFRKTHFDSTWRRRKPAKIGRTFPDIRFTFQFAGYISPEEQLPDKKAPKIDYFHSEFNNTCRDLKKNNFCSKLFIDPFSTIPICYSLPR